jgi:hypothetical protein
MFRANPSPNGRGCREAAGEGYKTDISLPLIRPFGPPSPFRRRIRPKLLPSRRQTALCWSRHTELLKAD